MRSYEMLARPRASRKENALAGIAQHLTASAESLSSFVLTCRKAIVRAIGPRWKRIELRASVRRALRAGTHRQMVIRRAYGSITGGRLSIVVLPIVTSAAMSRQYFAEEASTEEHSQRPGAGWKACV